MKKLRQKLLAALGAVTVAVTSAVPASAYVLTKEDMQNANLLKSGTINDPYLNITLDNGGINTSGMKFTLKKDGKAVATFDGGMSKASITDTSLGIKDITGVKTKYQFSDAVGNSNATKKVKISDLTSEMPELLYVGDTRQSGHNAGEDFTMNLYPNSEVYLGYLDAKIVDTMTVPTNKFVVCISDRYVARGDTDSDVSLANSSNEELYHYLKTAGKWEYDVPAGNYGIWFRMGGASNDVSAVIYNTPQKYVKLRIPATAMTGVSKTASGLIYEKNGLKYSVEKTAGTPYMRYIFRSRSVVTADIPDASGYIEVWAKEDEVDSLFFMTSPSDGSGGSNSEGLTIPYRFDKVQYTMPIPDKGVTLYNVPEGNYTVEVSDSAYQLAGNTLKVTKTGTLQQMNLKLSKKSGTTTTTTAATTTVTTTKPAETSAPESTAETTTAPESSLPDETSSEESSKDEESSQKEESSSQKEETSSVRSDGEGTVSPAGDSSSQADTSEDEDDSGRWKVIVIISVISLIALIAIIIAIILIRRDRKDDEDDD